MTSTASSARNGSVPSLRDVRDVHAGLVGPPSSEAMRSRPRPSGSSAAALLEQRGLRDERGVAVGLEQLGLDAQHLVGARALTPFSKLRTTSSCA